MNGDLVMSDPNAGTSTRTPIDLSRAGLGTFRRTRPKWFEFLWMVAEAVFVRNSLQISTRVRVAVLRFFGAKIGQGVIIRDIHVKFPWNLEVGDRAWLGERVWIHNQDMLTIGSDAVVSQESFITTGSHDMLKTMDLVTKPVRIGNGAWITSRCIVQMGVEIGENTVVTPGSVVRKSLPPGKIFGGNPAVLIRDRWPEDARS